MTDRELLKVALDTLERCEFGVISDVRLNATIQTLRQTLAQPEQEPVAYSDIVSDGGLDPRNAFDIAPLKREWVGLTDEEIKEIVGPWGDTPIKGYTRKLFDQIEAKLKEKNT